MICTQIRILSHIISFSIEIDFCVINSVGIACREEQFYLCVSSTEAFQCVVVAGFRPCVCLGIVGLVLNAAYRGRSHVNTNVKHCAIPQSYRRIRNDRGVIVERLSERRDKFRAGGILHFEVDCVLSFIRNNQSP